MVRLVIAFVAGLVAGLYVARNTYGDRLAAAERRCDAEQLAAKLYAARCGAYLRLHCPSGDGH